MKTTLFTIPLIMISVAFSGTQSIAETCGAAGEKPCKRESTTTYVDYVSCDDGLTANRFGYCEPDNVAAMDAVFHGCLSTNELDDALDELKDFENVGKISKAAISDFGTSAGWMTKLNVTHKDTCAFRALANPKERKRLVSEQVLTSKFELRPALFKGNPDSIGEFWRDNGPPLVQVPADKALIASAFRMLATSDSNKPASQFLSVALDYRTANSFGDNVYGFYVTPNSPILGLRQCDGLGGEVQYQIEGGTAVRELHRKIGNAGWEKLEDDGTWSAANRQNSDFLKDCLDPIAPRDPFFIENRWKPGKIIRESGGSLELDDKDFRTWEEKWIIVPSNPPFVLIKERRQGDYLFLSETGVRVTSSWNGDDISNVQWKIESVVGSAAKYVRIRSKYDGSYLNNQDGKLTASRIWAGAFSAQWRLNTGD